MQKSIQSAITRVIELMSSRRSLHKFEDVIDRAMDELNMRAARDTNYTALTRDQLVNAHAMHMKLCEKAGLKQERRRSRVRRTSKVRIIKTRKLSRPPSVRAREGQREAIERYEAEEMLGLHLGACHLRDSPRSFSPRPPPPCDSDASRPPWSLRSRGARVRPLHVPRVGRDGPRPQDVADARRAVHREDLGHARGGEEAQRPQHKPSPRPPFVFLKFSPPASGPRVDI